jgi:membrane fusion protein (multidrug efflux system)
MFWHRECCLLSVRVRARHQSTEGLFPAAFPAWRWTVAPEAASAPTIEPAKPALVVPQHRAWPGWIVPSLVLLLAVVLLFVIAGNWNAWVGGEAKQTTDDAYLHADVTPLSTKISGVVAKVNVSDYQQVKAGDLLVKVKDDDYQAQVAQADAGVAAARAAIENNRRQKQLQQAKIDRTVAGVGQAQAEISGAQAGIDAAQADLYRAFPERQRQENLIATGSTTRQKVEQAVADDERSRAQLISRQAGLAQAKAALASSESAVDAERRGLDVLNSQEAQFRADLSAKQAALDAARANLAYTRINAPTDGMVGERKVRPGQMVNPGTQVISLVEDDVWVQANYKETQLTHVAVGNTAEIKVDAFPGIVLRGRVSNVSPASGSQFSLLPPDNATGNFTKVTQRIPVKITLEPDSRVAGKLRPGMSVLATIDTRSGH